MGGDENERVCEKCPAGYFFSDVGQEDQTSYKEAKATIYRTAGLVMAK
jgi:hypothetical protein